jgi:hypothetical protein
MDDVLVQEKTILDIPALRRVSQAATHNKNVSSAAQHAKKWIVLTYSLSLEPPAACQGPFHRLDAILAIQSA